MHSLEKKLVSQKNEKSNDKSKVKNKKNADKKLNRVIIPKFFIEKFGQSFYMEVYEDYIKLIPVRKEK